MFGMSSGAILAFEAAAHGLAIKKFGVVRTPFVGNDSTIDYWITRCKLKKLIAAKRAATRSSSYDDGRHACRTRRNHTIDADVAKLKALAPTLIYDATHHGRWFVAKPSGCASVTVPTMVMTVRRVLQGCTIGASACGRPSQSQHRTLEGQTPRPQNENPCSC